MKPRLYFALLLLLCGALLGIIGCAAKYSLSIEQVPDQGGNIVLLPKVPEYNSGMHVTATAQPLPGWRFSHWKGDIEREAGNKASVLMDKDKTITAYFVKTYTLSVNTDPKGAGLLSAESGNYDMGNEVIIDVQPYYGWRFDKWGGDVSSTSNQIIIKMNGDKKIIAYFIKDEADQR